MHASAFRNGFALDDVPLVRDDVRIRSLDALGGLALAPYWPPDHGGAAAGLYRPVATVSFALNRALTGADAAGFHLVNVLMHALASVLAWYVARACSTTYGTAFAAATLFAVHPLHTEAVVAIAGRAELLGAACVLAAFMLHRRGRGVLAGLAYLLALLSKENTVLAPLVFVVADRLQHRTPGLRRYGYFAFALAVALGLRLVALGGLRGAETLAFIDDPAAAAGLLPRLLTAAWVQLSYARLFVFPLRLSADYSYDAIPVVGSLADPRFAAGVLWLAALVAALVISRKRAAPVAIGITWWIAFFLPTANLLFPSGTLMAERLAYLPSFGGCLVAGHLAARAARTHRVLALCAVALIAAALAWRTIERVPVWRDNLTLAVHDARVTPRSAKLHAGAAIALHAAGKLADAEASYREALAIYPDYAQMHYNLGQLLVHRGARAEAIEHLARAAELSPHRPEPLRTLAPLLAQSGRLAEALVAYEAALRLDPGDTALREGYERARRAAQRPGP